MLGSWTFLIPFIFFRVFISAFLKIIIILTGNIHAKTAYKRVASEIYFKAFITMSIEGLFCCVIVSYLNLKTIEFTSFGEKLGAALSFYCTSFSIVIMPSVLIYILIFKKYEQIKVKEFREIWGSLFSFMKIKKIINRIYYLIFILRRYLYIVVFTLY